MATTGKGMPMTHNMAQKARLPMLIAFAPDKSVVKRSAENLGRLTP